MPYLDDGHEYRAFISEEDWAMYQERATERFLMMEMAAQEANRERRNRGVFIFALLTWIVTVFLGAIMAGAWGAAFVAVWGGFGFTVIVKAVSE